MDEKQKLLLKFFSQHPNQTFDEDDLPEDIKIHFDVGMELPDCLYQLQLRQLIKTDRLGNRYSATPSGISLIRQIEPMTEIDKMNLLLKQLNTKKEGECHHLDELSKATSFDLITIDVIGHKIHDKGDCDYHHHCVSITGPGIYTAMNGGYKEDLPVPFMHVVNDHSTTITGHGNVVAPNNLGEIKTKVEKNVEDKETKQLNKVNVKLSKRNIYVGLIAIVVMIILGLWQQGCIG